MILDIIKSHTHEGRTMHPGQKLEVTRDLGRHLVAIGVASEVKPAMLDAHAFNILMSAVDKQRMRKIEEEEEE
jgi:hypothetical protein